MSSWTCKGRIGSQAGEGDVGLQRSPFWRDEGRRGSGSVKVSSAKERWSRLGVAGSAPERWCPVSKERRQGKKGTAATQYCNMAAVVFLSHTAVFLTRRSSSPPCGVGLESPNLSAALPNMVAYGGSRPHIAPVVMTVYMPCSS